MSSTQKLAVVLGATGNQGGSVVKTLLAEGYRIRGITRNTKSDKALALQTKNIELVQGDLDDINSLHSAFADAQFIFIVSDWGGVYYAAASEAAATSAGSSGAQREPVRAVAGRREEQQLKNAIEAAAGVTTLERMVFSGLSKASKWSKGKFVNIHHFDSKANAAEWGAEKFPELWKKTSILQAGFFLPNFLGMDPLKPYKDTDGTVIFANQIDPKAMLPIYSPDQDTGPLVLSLLNDKPGKNLLGYREWITFDQFLEAFRSATGRQAKQVRLTSDEAQAKSPMPEDLRVEFDENFWYINEFGFEGRADTTVVHPGQLAVPAKTDTTEEWFKEQDWSFLD